MKKFYNFSIIFALLFLFFGCSENTDQSKEKSKSDSIKEAQMDPNYFDKLKFEANNGTIIYLSRKKPITNNNFKSIEPQDTSSEQVLSELIVDSNNKATMLFFFTAWCEPCAGLLPHLTNLQNNFSTNLQIIGLPLDDISDEMLGGSAINAARMDLDEFIMQNNLSFGVVLERENRARLMQAVGVLRGIPLMVLFAPSGEFVMHYLGAIPEEMLEFEINQVLNRAQ